ncbi:MULTISPECIES: hypothetical protein [unclassified Rathayibacter]|uniref:hypothetical protein n=1 Tax=unclassified Rathayibacter TaxID=2609250 RepID=UPI0006F28E26|nr:MULTISPECIES: hypothetical protein [unclassified Rathayibacter]KQQ05602.1 hypothetical protein ASF42_03280 [Rathayibacter sp. Leaf294]KQS13463.1 hypothetical protein ASG06_03290 [Rathayibacter sp. Leaf185]
MDDETLLAALHRGRPSTLAEASVLTDLDSAELQTAVDRLRDRGLLRRDGDALGYIPPAEWASEAIARHTEAARLATRESMDGIERIVAGLPSLLGAWSVGESSADLVPTLLRSGPHASEDLWFDLVRRDSGTLDAVLPDVERFLDPPSERAQRFGQALMAKDRVRVIIPAASIGDPRVLARVDAYQRAGVQYRLLESPPCWFWVDGEHLAVPFQWGETRPTSVLGVRHGGLAGLAGAYFEELWRQSTPVGAVEQPWTPLLRLMQKGITLETASKRLGINPRTGRRRVAAAMEHHGVSTLFALGAAWAADGSAPQGADHTASIRVTPGDRHAPQGRDPVS